MSEYGMELTTPVGRIVWGHPTKPRNKKHTDGAQKGQNVIDPNTGQPVMEVSFGVAIPKFATVQQLYPNLPPEQQQAMSFEYAVWPVMQAEIATGYPNGTPPRFSYKYSDGDGIDSEGKPFNQREGYAGHIVLAYTQRINDTFGVPSVFKFNPQTGKYDTLPGDAIKCGDYVAVGTNFKVNVAQGTNTPSVYVNPKAVELVGYGQPIITAGAVDPNAMFGGANRMLPPGASATPTQAPNAAGMPGMGQPQGMPGQMPQQQPMMQPQQQPMQPVQQPQMMPQQQQPMQPQPMMQPQPGQMPAPAPDFVANAGYVAPQQPVMQPQPGQMMPQQPVMQPHPGQMPGMMPGTMPGR